MNAKLTKYFGQVNKLDGFTQLAIFGAWAYTVASSCINNAIKYVPVVDEASGIEGASQFEQARIAFIKDAEESNLPGLLAIHREIAQQIELNDGQVRSLENTLEFMTGNKPKREQFEREFEDRRRLGMRPGIAKKEFVDIEFDRALKKHDTLIALGEHAVRLCETVTTSTMTTADGTDCPEWMLEAFQNKMIDKLHARWAKIEITRTNPRMKKSIRDGAEADQLLIKELLSEYDETPGFVGEDPDLEPVTTAVDPFDKDAGDLSKVNSVKPNPAITAG